MDVVFPVMPFADAGRPSMGVSLLAAEVEAAGHSADVVYFNLDLAGEMGLADYQRVASGFPPNLLIGEWIFAQDVFGSEIPAPDQYFADVLAPVTGPDRALFEAISAARRRAGAYLDACAREIAQRRPQVVGFSTVFHQTLACVALARRLKAAPDAAVVVFGGANCEGPMGLRLLRSFDCIDFVCSGEADVSFPRLLDALAAGESAPVAGVLARGAAREPVRSAPVLDMDALPYPVFDGYFARLATSRLAGLFDAHLVFESSRGCWWGAKHHCTFCGLNGDTMAFRSKSPERAFAEIAHLTQRYGSRKLGCVDNILDMKYVTTLFPRLIEAGCDLELFYEVKSNLRYEQLAQMRAGGVTQIQPGIESFCDEVLKLMDKGCTGLQNIQLMRWCAELGVEVSWNILAGFPGEQPEAYGEMAALIPLLAHLDPPCAVGMVRLDRFSPFHTRASEFGFERVRPARAYFHVYPFGRRELAELAYFFDYDYADGRDPRGYIAGVQAAVQSWIAARGAAEPARLDARVVGATVEVVDTRPCREAPSVRLTGLDARLLQRCDAVAGVAALPGETGAPAAAVEAALARLEGAGLIVRRGDRVLSLPVFRDRGGGDLAAPATSRERREHVSETAVA